MNFLKFIPKLIAVCLVFGAYSLATESTLNSNEIEAFKDEFSFEKQTLYKHPATPDVLDRPVHPQYDKISSWVSSVGAAIALFDFDGNGIDDDVVHIEPRNNHVYIYSLSKQNPSYDFIFLDLSKFIYHPENASTPPSGMLTNDFNNDGKEDILIFFLGRSPIIFYQNENFELIPDEITFKDTYNTTSAVLADINGDGYADIIFGNYFPDDTKLYYPNSTDKNQTMQHSMSRADNGAPNRLFIWKGINGGKAEFKEEKDWYKDFKYPNDWTLAIAAGDFNGDFLPDLYIANDFGCDKLLLNKSTKDKIEFVELFGSKNINTLHSNVIGHDTFKGMGADFNDINNDGLFDIYVSNIADDYALNESHFVFINNEQFDKMNRGTAPFQNQSEKLGLSRSSWGWDSKITDFNNDGIKEAIQATGFIKGNVNRWPQLQELATMNDELLSNPNNWPMLKPGDDLSGDAHVFLFAQNEKGKFHDISKAIGIDENQISRGIAIADVNNDGLLDFALANQWQDSNLYINKSKNTNTYISLELLYPNQINTETKAKIINQKSNERSAINSVVKFDLNGQKFIAQVDGGNGHAGKNSKKVHFGLGDFDKNSELEIEIHFRTNDGKPQKETMKLKPGNYKILLPFYK